MILNEKEEKNIKITFPLRYRLGLANGDSWVLYVSYDLITWGKELARILGLKEETAHHQNPKKIFFCTDETKCYCEIISQNSNHSKISRYSFPGMELRYYSSTNSYFVINSLIHHKLRHMRYFPMMSALYPIYRDVMKNGGIVLHAALLHHPDIGGIAILASGGTGKSTCAETISPPWSSYCDDMMLVVRAPDSLYYAHPLPTWSNIILNPTHIPLRAMDDYIRLDGLFFLNRAEYDKVIALPAIDAAQWIYESSIQTFGGFIDYMTKEEQFKHKNIIFYNACQLARNCPSFILKALYHGYFWREIEKQYGTERRKITSENELI
jgi:SynChlorMet cassette protein ScmC